MSQEQNFDLIAWWNEQSFAGKELFRLEETGELILLANSNIKEHVVATVSPENAAVVLNSLQEKFGQVEAKVRELEVEWLATEDKQKLADKVAQIKEYVQQSAAVGDYLKLAALIHDWQHTIYILSEESYAAKLKLTELAESLAQSEEWKETSQAFRDIADKWKQMGHVDKNRNDKLWSRVEAARKAFHERKRVHQEDEEKNMLHNMDLKIDLVEQAEAIAASEDWKKTSDTFQRLTEEWKTIGHTVNKKNEELWQRFIAAKTAFFDRKREHSNKIHVEQEKNYEIKLAIVERAELLKDSRDWNVTSQAFAALMEEWKKTGRIPHEKGDELWKRFTEIQDHFFEGKKKHFDELRSNQENNYLLKKELYDRAEKIKNSNKWGETTAEMIELLEEWKKIGPIPRSYGDKMWEDFNAARKYFFARKDANREQRKQYVETQKVVRAKHAKDAVKNLHHQIKEEEDKLEDFKNGLENITPGKKAAELRAHLENLIAESTKNLEHLKQKYAQARHDIDAVAVKREAAPETADTEGSAENESDDGEN